MPEVGMQVFQQRAEDDRIAIPYAREGGMKKLQALSGRRQRPTAGDAPDCVEQRTRKPQRRGLTGYDGLTIGALIPHCGDPDDGSLAQRYAKP